MAFSFDSRIRLQRGGFVMQTEPYGAYQLFSGL